VVLSRRTMRMAESERHRRGYGVSPPRDQNSLRDLPTNYGEIAGLVEHD